MPPVENAPATERSGSRRLSLNAFIRWADIYCRGLRSRSRRTNPVDRFGSFSDGITGARWLGLDGNGSATGLGVGFVGGRATVSARDAIEKNNLAVRAINLQNMG